MIDLFYSPTQVIWGLNRLPDLLERLAAKPPYGLVCSSQLLRRSPDVFSCLGDATDWIFWHDFDARRNCDTINAGARALEKCGVLVAVGGGTAMDTAKLVAAALATSADCEELLNSPGSLVSTRPVIAVPTTAGTGSEVSKVAIVYDREGNNRALIHPVLFPRCAILDAKLTLTLPVPQAAVCAIDALSHAVESYLSKGATPFSEGLSLVAARQLLTNIPRLPEDPGCLQVREGLLMGSCLAAMAFTNAGLTMAHGLARAIGSRVSAPHGQIMAALLAPEMRFNGRFVPQRLENLARETGFGNGEELVARVDELRDLFRLPATLRELGVQREDLDWISQNGGPMRANPFKPSPEELRNFLENIYDSG